MTNRASWPFDSGIVMFGSGQAGLFGLGLGSSGPGSVFIQARALSPDPGRVGSGLGSSPRLG